VIPVQPAPEPPDFDAKVRQPGLRAIAARVGEQPAPGGRPPKLAQKATCREDLKPSDFPAYWSKVRDDLLDAYRRICAYACTWIPPVSGTPSVDHFAPKSRRWDRVYEWSNYRLAGALINARKRDFGDVLDPFDVHDGMFALDLLALKAVPGPNAGDRSAEVEATIARLGLDGRDYHDELEHYYQEYTCGSVSIAFLHRYAPFLAQELRRQGRMRPDDGLPTV